MCFLKMVKDSAAGIELGRSLHQEGTVNVKVLERDFVFSLKNNKNSHSPQTLEWGCTYEMTGISDHCDVCLCVLFESERSFSTR